MKNKNYKSPSLKVSVRNTDLKISAESPSNAGRHKLATIMFSDISGFTKMMGEDEAKTMEIVERNRQIQQKSIHDHNGTLIKEMGDGLMASFESTHDAVRCAKEIMSEIDSSGEYQLHIGIHLGDIIFTSEDIFGDGVNIAARINSCAQEGEIVVSEEVWKNIKNNTEFNTEPLGKRNLKNVDLPVKLYRVLLDDEKRSIQLKAIVHTYSTPLKVGITAMLLISIALSVYFLIQKSGGINSEEVNTIAILPFDNRSNDQDFEYLSEGLAEDIISELFHLSSFSVISSRSSFRYKNSDKQIQQISRELKADILLTGNYSVESDKVLVKVEMIKGSNSEILNYASLSAQLNEVGSISTLIRNKIYETLNIHSGEAGVRSGKGKNDINSEAYKYYLMGKSAMHDNTMQKLEDITRYFQAAIAIDSNYIDPYIGMAEAYIFDVNRGYVSPVIAAQKAKKYALQAEKLRPGSGEVSGIMGIIHLFDFEFGKALPYFERSIELSPNYDISYHWYSFTLEALGNFSKSEQLLKKASILDPLDNFNGFYLNMNYIYQKKYAEAQQVLDEILAVEPNHLQTLFQQAVLYLQQEKYQQAYDALVKRGIGLETNFIAGYTYAMVGMEDKARVVLSNMLQTSAEGYVPPSQIAIVYCGLHEYDRSIEEIEKAFLVHDPWIIWIKNTNLTAPLWEDPKFRSLMARLNSDVK